MDDRRPDLVQEEPEPEIKVTDRRLFTADGNLRGEAHEQEADALDASTDLRPSGFEPEAEVGATFERRPLDEPTDVDFTMLINAMAGPALQFLGEIPHPATGRPELDTGRAKFQIDMLDLLRIKCRGNLSAEESSLLDRILYQLRMLYVSRAKASAG